MSGLSAQSEAHAQDRVTLRYSERERVRRKPWRCPQGGARSLASLIAGIFVLLGASTLGEARELYRWDFHKIDDRQGWEVRPGARGVVMGGALWLTLSFNPPHTALSYEFVGAQPISDVAEVRNLIASPRGLDLPVSAGTQVRLRILNLSPVTDLNLIWRAKDQEWNIGGGDTYTLRKRPPQSQHCALKQDLKQWQEVTCYIDADWRGRVDQVAIRPALYQQIRGDLWIDSIEIVQGVPPVPPVRPDVMSPRVVPKVTIPGISQDGFADAFKVLDECLVIDVPTEGFTHPFMAPGGYYGDHWYALDTSLTVNAVKWVNQSFAEGVMRGFRDVQAVNPDGRIPGFGMLASGQVADISQTPRFFEVAYDVARRTRNASLRAEIYDTMRKYLDWWTSPAKRDADTGLIVALGDDVDTLSAVLGWRYPPGVLPIDLNMAVAVGADRTAKLAAHLGRKSEASRYRQLFQEISHSINATLWDEQTGVYYNYILAGTDRRTGESSAKWDRRVIAPTLEPLRLGIASVAQRERLINRLIDPNAFNWGKVPLTTVAMTDPSYVESQGNYNLGAWQGNVWIYRNIEVIKGLEEAGRPDLAAELNWSTIKIFHGNYWENLNHSGAGQGTNRYGWTASQYVEAIIEHLFGVDYDAIEKRVRIEPRVPKELYGQDIALEALILPTGADTRLAVHIKQSAPTTARIRIEIEGKLPDSDLVVTLPGANKESRFAMRRSLSVNF